MWCCIYICIRICLCVFGLNQGAFELQHHPTPRIDFSVACSTPSNASCAAFEMMYFVVGIVHVEFWTIYLVLGKFYLVFGIVYLCMFDEKFGIQDGVYSERFWFVFWMVDFVFGMIIWYLMTLMVMTMMMMMILMVKEEVQTCPTPLPRSSRRRSSICTGRRTRLVKICILHCRLLFHTILHELNTVSWNTLL